MTASEMREIDRKAIEEFGVPSLDLMERAGGGAAQVIAAIGLDPDKPVVILCGKGNNGGDGFVAARHLRQFGADVVCWMMGERDEMTSDALRNLVAAEESGVRIRSFRVDENEAELAEDLAKCQYAVDAMLGTGAKGALRDPIRRLTHLMNDSEARTFALDVPTGLDADTGEVDPDCVQAMMTITFGFPKRGLYALPGRDYCGDITVIDLAYPEESVEVSTGVLLWQEMAGIVPDRNPRGYKGSFGHVAIVAGSLGMAGAACLAAESALRSGAGLAKLYVPESIAAICAMKLTEVMVFGVPDDGRGTFGPDALEPVLAGLREADAVVLGPGLSGAPGVREFVHALVPRVDRPLVVDADALNVLGDAPEEVLERIAGAPAILTPHPGELARLTGAAIAEIAGDTVTSAQRAANRFGCEVVLKGAPSVVATPRGTVDLCSLGNDGMATAGSGDVLAGLLGGLLAQGLEAARSARLGTMVHSRAGDICRNEIGARGMLAGDLMRCLPYAWRELEAPHEHLSYRFRLEADDEDDESPTEDHGA
ncbi:MAG: NAD(P)H-hydrate dehydratase [bacterium]